MCVFVLRLYVELRESIEKQLQTLPMGAGLDEEPVMDEEAMKKLQEQIQLSLQVCRPRGPRLGSKAVTLMSTRN